MDDTTGTLACYAQHDARTYYGMATYLRLRADQEPAAARGYLLDAIEYQDMAAAMSASARRLLGIE